MIGRIVTVRMGLLKVADRILYHLLSTPRSPYIVALDFSGVLEMNILGGRNNNAGCTMVLGEF